MKCPNCEENYKRLGQHWIFKPEHRPNFTDKQIEILKGVLMGDGSYNDKASKNPKITIESTNKKYLEKLKQKIPKLTTNIRKSKTAKQSAQKAKESGFHVNATEENYSNVYRLSTRSHPQLKKFSEWYTESGKKFPENIELTPTILKHWYVCDGSLQNKQFRMSLVNEKENREKIEKMFQEAGLPKPNTWVKENNGIAIWNKDETKKIFNYMDKIECYDYKFPKNSS